MKRLTPWILVILLGLVAAVFTLRPAPTTRMTQGGQAPDFALPLVETGQPFTLAGTRGQVVLVNFWATWCPPCRREIPDFIRLRQELGPRGFEIVGLAMDEGGADVVLPFVRQVGINYPVVLGTQEIAASYGGIRGIPTSFLLDRQGRMVRMFPGMIDGATLRQAVVPLL